MREIRVSDIAKRTGVSPGSFYQYFRDLEDAVCTLAGEAREATPRLVEMIEGDWSGASGLERGRDIANHVIDHWERFAPVLRARNNASDEGHLGLREERMAALFPLVDAFRKVIEANEDSREEDASSPPSTEKIDPLVAAVAMTCCLERTSMYRTFIQDQGGSRQDVVNTTAIVLQRILVSRR